MKAKRDTKRKATVTIILRKGPAPHDLITEYDLYGAPNESDEELADRISKHLEKTFATGNYG